MRLLRAMLAVQRRHAHLLTHGEWTPLAARSDDCTVVGSRWRLGDDELLALANLRDAPFAGDGRARRPQTPSLGCRRSGSRRSRADGVDGLRRRLAAYPARETVRLHAPEARVDAVPRRVRRRPAAAAARGAVPRARDRDLRRGALRRGVEAAAAAAARLRRGRAAGARGPFAIAVREVTGADGAPLTGLSLAEARRTPPGRARGSPTEDEWQLAAEARPARARRAARLELDRERAPRRPHALRDPQGRLAPGAPRARTGTSTAARRRPSSRCSCCSPARCSARRSIGFRLAVDLA